VFLADGVAYLASDFSIVTTLTACLAEASDVLLAVTEEVLLLATVKLAF